MWMPGVNLTGFLPNVKRYASSDCLMILKNVRLTVLAVIMPEFFFEMILLAWFILCNITQPSSILKLTHRTFFKKMNIKEFPNSIIKSRLLNNNHVSYYISPDGALFYYDAFLGTREIHKNGSVTYAVDNGIIGWFTGSENIFYFNSKIDTWFDLAVKITEVMTKVYTNFAGDFLSYVDPGKGLYVYRIIRSKSMTVEYYHTRGDFLWAKTQDIIPGAFCGLDALWGAGRQEKSRNLLDGFWQIFSEGDVITPEIIKYKLSRPPKISRGLYDLTILIND